MNEQLALIGKRLGPYAIQSLIGSGGMGSVYRAIDLNLQRAVAVKVLAPALASQPGWTERFRQEARIIASLRHPNIVEIYNFGEQDGLTYIVEELLAGPTLGDRLKEMAAQGQRFAREQVITIIKELASALDAAHAAGIIHRDIKPQNAIWDANGQLVLTDFGVARQMGTDSGYTQTGMIIGTPHYLSPEQAQGLPLTPASDVYALAVVLYELLTGQVPFDGDTPMRAVVAHIQSPPPHLPPRPDLPPAVDAVVQQALAKDPAARFSSAGDLARALEQAWTTGKAATAAPGGNIHEEQTAIWTGAPPTARPVPPPASSPVPAVPGRQQRPPAGATAVQPPLPSQRASDPQGSNERGLFPSIPLLGGLVVLALLCGLAMTIFSAAGDNDDVAAVPTDTPVATTAPDPTATVEPAPTMEEAPTATSEPTAAPTAEPSPTPESSPTPEPAAPPPPVPYSLVFSSDREGSRNIFAMNARGDELRQLTADGGSNFAPDWSPDGRFVAFHANLDGDEDIYVLDTESGDLQAITENDGVGDRDPAWSPDGRFIVYQSNPFGTWDIYAIGANGGSPERLTDDLADSFAPAWSPDGQRIAFTTNRDGNDEIYVMGTDGENERNLTNSGASDKLPAWGPDGRLAFMSDRDGNGEIYIMDGSGGRPTNLTRHPAWDTQPAWSPDGSVIAFTTDRDNNSEIYLMDASGGNVTRLTDDPAEDWDAAWSR